MPATMAAPLARVRRRTLRLCETARRLTPAAQRARTDECLAAVLGTERLDAEDAFGRSALNSDGTPLQLCLTARPGGQALRYLGDPCAHLSGAARIDAARQAMGTAMRTAGAAGLRPSAEALLARVLPQDRAAQDTFRDGALWLGLAAERPGLALYVEAARADWDIAGAWLADLLPDAGPAHQAIAGLRPHCAPASFGLEGLDAGKGRAKIYFRLTAPQDVHALGLAPLASPEMLDVLAIAMAGRGVDLDGLVMSMGFDLATGALVDCKADLCGHCLDHTPEDWQRIVTACCARLEIPPVDVAPLLDGGETRIAFLGCGVSAERAARLNLYLQPSPDARPNAPESLRAAAEDAVAYLLAQQREDGHWQDYELPVGASDQWITGYLGMSLAEAADRLHLPAARAAAERAADWLCRDRPYAAGWGYNASTGPDSDSTAMVLTLLHRLDRPCAEADTGFLAARWPEGASGISTYDGSDAWAQAHWDVTPYAYAALPAAARAARADGFRRGLADNLQPDGTWRAYWWRSPLYGTLLTREVLDALGEPPPEALPRRLSLGAETTLDLACAVGIAHLHGTEAADLAGALAALLRRQLPDGGFPGGADLRVTDQACTAPWDAPDGQYFTDIAGSFTTATALRVLARLWQDRAGAAASAGVAA